MTVHYAPMQTDGYKLFHKDAYGKGITQVYSNFTSRNGRLSNLPDNDAVVFVGLQYFIKDYLINEWNETFFNRDKASAVLEMKRYIDAYLGINYDVSHLDQLHDLGYLPLEIKALPEGVSVPYGVPPVTFTNTHPDFAWLTNYIETVFSNENWPIQTAATTSKAYLKNFVKSFVRTGGDLDMIPFLGHDFSKRGMFGRQAAAMNGFGHLCCFAGTDTLPSIMFAEKYYNANVDNELVGCSVPATEHSTTTSYIAGKTQREDLSQLEAEVDYVRYLFTKAPTGILSHVSDSYDFWKFVTEGLPMLKDEIMARDGTFVVRPDSGDPVKILTGYKLDGKQFENDEEFYHYYDYCNLAVPEAAMIDGQYYEVSVNIDGRVGRGERPLCEAEVKGLVQTLYDIFGGTYTKEGYILLDSHIGAIYGDSITIERQEQIIKRLEEKGFVPNLVLGIGSYSYQYVTRDTHGSAVKATSVVWDGEQVDVFKDPKTDSKKKSAKGLLRVELKGGKYVLYDQQTPEQEQQGELNTVFLDGKLVYETSLDEIRQRIKVGILL